MSTVTSGNTPQPLSALLEKTGNQSPSGNITIDDIDAAETLRGPEDDGVRSNITSSVSRVNNPSKPNKRTAVKRPLSSNLDTGRKIPVSMEIATALSRARHSDGRKVKNAFNLAGFIQQIQYWTDIAQKNRDMDNDGMKGHIDDEGRLWFYNGMGSWERNFPCWTARTIRRLRDELVSLGIVLSQVRGKEWEDDEPDEGKSVTWFHLNHAGIDALVAGEEAPPDNSPGVTTLQGGTPDNLTGGTPDNLSPHHRVLTENTKKTTNPAGAGGGGQSYDIHVGEVAPTPPGSGEYQEEKKDKQAFQPVGDTDLERFLSARLEIKRWPQDWLDELHRPMTIDGQANDAGLSADDLYRQSRLFRAWVDDEFIPWFLDPRKGKRKGDFCKTLRANWRWWTRYEAEQTGIPTNLKGKKKGVGVDPNDPKWDDSNFNIF